jgi:ribonuclease P protein subunit RPR2
MVRIARERIADLFALAEREATRGGTDLPDRYVRLARRIGTRYNVRLLPEYREVFCRGCSSYWVEGRTVRTRLRSGHRVRTCLRCGRARRVVTRSRTRQPAPPGGPSAPLAQADGALVGEEPGLAEESEEDEGPEEA